MKNNEKVRDLNLLRVFVVIGEERNLSRAAGRLGISQPGLSHALKRLRAEFGDPLYVRAPRGLVPTARAESLLPQIRERLALVDKLYDSAPTMDFRARNGSWVLATTTYFEMRILGRVLKALRLVAPHVAFETRSLTEGFPKAELEEGRIDLAVAAYFQSLPEGFRVRSLGSDPHVCVMRKGHPASGGLTLERYLAAEHVKIAVPPGSVSAVDRALAARGKSRRIVAHLANFVTPALALKKTDLLLTCPRTLAQNYAKNLGLTWTKLPLPVPPVDVKMAWHERTHADPFQRWFREQIVAAARGEELDIPSPNRS